MSCVACSQKLLWPSQFMVQAPHQYLHQVRRAIGYLQLIITKGRLEKQVSLWKCKTYHTWTSPSASSLDCLCIVNSNSNTFLGGGQLHHLLDQTNRCVELIWKAPRTKKGISGWKQVRWDFLVRSGLNLIIIKYIVSTCILIFNIESFTRVDSIKYMGVTIHETLEPPSHFRDTLNWNTIWTPFLSPNVHFLSFLLSPYHCCWFTKETINDLPLVVYTSHCRMKCLPKIWYSCV